jgi:hypothetical protein
VKGSIDTPIKPVGNEMAACSSPQGFLLAALVVVIAVRGRAEWADGVVRDGFSIATEGVPVVAAVSGFGVSVFDGIGAGAPIWAFGVLGVAGMSDAAGVLAALIAWGSSSAM